ncbi:MAG: thioredoxin-like domain-containing protein, partial [Ferruginibacter sp.]
NEKTELLKRLANLYTGNEKVLAFIRNETNKANTEIENLVAQLSHKYPSLLSVSFIKSSLPVKLPATGDLVAYKKIHYFDNVDFSNSAILRSDVISSLLQGYFSLYEDPSYTYTEQVENYALALDRILGKASKNKVIYEFLRTDLTNKYRYGNLDILGAYLMQFYSTDNFFPALIKEPDIKKRLQSLNHVSLGKQAPDIVMPTYDGKQERLKDIKTDYTLLVFWSTDCSHCTTMLPQLKQVYEMKKKQSDLEVLAVSFDTNQDAWQNFIKAGNYSWINYSDLKGWESEIARNYKIQGTPTYILLNKDKTVIYKPTTLEDLIGKLKTLNII